MYKLDFALDNQQWLMCHKTKPSYDDNYYIASGDMTESE